MLGGMGGTIKKGRDIECGHVTQITPRVGSGHVIIFDVTIVRHRREQNENWTPMLHDLKEQSMPHWPNCIGLTFFMKDSELNCQQNDSYCQ